jgi:N-methylhydantoinase B/oxoprolinase/acetone carboxylase alpha subunit/acetone carboxylase gamma subunit
MALDPVRYEIFYQKLEMIINEGKEVVRYLSTGVITREAGEIQEAIYLPNGEAALISSGILMHIMNVTRVISYMNTNKYDADDIGIYEDDQFINNDAYIGGMHNPDTACIAPIFYEGKLIAYVAAISHTTEIGAIEPGGMSPLATEAIHDGIHLPAVKLVERGKIRRDVLNLILRAVRDPITVELDIRARLAGNERTKKRIKELIDEFGVSFFEEACKKLVDDAEAFARERIKALRPGIYRARAYDENAGIKEQLAVMEIEAEATEAGDLLIRIPVISPQNRSFNNAYLPAVEAAVFYIILVILLYDCRWNSGISRAIKIDYVPEKSRLNASPDASVGYATVGIGEVFADTLTVAISRALYAAGRVEDVMGPSTCANAIIAGGISQYGHMTANILTSTSTPRGAGARVDRDGIDSSVTVYNPWTYISDSESEETLLPIINFTRMHRPDSGGFGKFRGGIGTENVTMIYNSPSMTINHIGTGKRIPENQGLFGGYPGCSSFFDWMVDTNISEIIENQSEIPYGEKELFNFLKGEYITGEVCMTSGDRILKTGDIMHSTTCGGGGGLGDPIERDPMLIVRDIENMVATLEIAQKVYAVAIRPETIEIDYEETEKLRGKRRKERLEQGLQGIKYLEKLIQAREKLPQFILDFFNEIKNFCPSFRDELSKEKEIVAKGLKPLGEVKIVEKIFSLTPYVDIVLDKKGRKLAVCSKCGFVYCEANENFKLHCLIYERDPSNFHSGRLAYDREWCIFREFYCPSCASQTEVEAIVPGTPILNDYELKF